jgi:hypothetical protein
MTTALWIVTAVALMSLLFGVLLERRGSPFGI